MKVCLLTNDYPPIRAGISVYMKGLSEGFSALGHHCCVIFLPVNAHMAAGYENVITIPVSGQRTFTRVLRCWRALRKVVSCIKECHLIVVSAWSPTGIAYAFGFPPGPGQKSVLLAHGNEILEPSGSPIHRILMRQVFRRFDIVVSNSQYTAGLCNRIANTKAVPIGAGVGRMILNGMAKRSRLIPGEANEPFTLLSVGRLIERKGFHLVIRSLALISDEIPEWRYIIVGSGPYETTLRQLIEETRLGHRVSFLKDIETPELLGVYQSADVFVMPSREIPEEGEVEGLGLVYMEAGAAALPCIAGNSGGVPDVISHGINGLMVNPLSTQEISQAILKLYRDKELRQELGANGRSLAESEWTWSKVAQRLIEATR